MPSRGKWNLSVPFADNRANYIPKSPRAPNRITKGRLTPPVADVTIACEVGWLSGWQIECSVNQGRLMR